MASLLLSLQQFLFVLLATACYTFPAQAWVSPEIKQIWSEGYTASKAIQTIEECAEAGNPRDDLFCAVKFMDRFANNQHYPTMTEKEALMNLTYGSWELRLALNSDKEQDFYPHPEFRAFAMAFITVDDKYFGKGIGTGPGFCFVALGGPSSRSVRTRQVFMEYEDYYINGQTVPGWDLSYYMRGYQRNWVSPERNRPRLAFTVVAATEKALLLRGNKTGGMAIFRRINDDMRPTAYGLS